MKTQKRILGDLGERLACYLLSKNNFSILERNYLKPCGEIDIIVQKEDILYFVEVKTVTYKTNNPDSNKWGIKAPEENIDAKKIKRLRSVVSAYLKEKRVKIDWKLMIISVAVEKLPKGHVRAYFNVFYDVL